MNQKDKKILNRLQENFPITESPYKVLGDRVGLSENQVIDKIKKLKAKGVIRRIGGVFESKKMNHSSALVAAKIPKDRLKKAAAIISAYREVTHNYLRPHEYNVWFTITAASDREIRRIADCIKKAAGIDDLFILPATQKFKIDTKFRL